MKLELSATGAIIPNQTKFWANPIDNKQTKTLQVIHFLGIYSKKYPHIHNMYTDNQNSIISTREM